MSTATIPAATIPAAPPAPPAGGAGSTDHAAAAAAHRKREYLAAAWVALRDDIALPDPAPDLTGDSAKAEQQAAALFTGVLDEFNKGEAAAELARLSAVVSELHTAAEKAKAEEAAAKTKLADALSGGTASQMLKVRASASRASATVAEAEEVLQVIEARLAAAGQAAAADLLRRADAAAQAAQASANVELKEAKGRLSTAMAAELPNVHLQLALCQLLVPHAVRQRLKAETLRLTRPADGAGRVQPAPAPAVQDADVHPFGKPAVVAGALGGTLNGPPDGARPRPAGRSFVLGSPADEPAG